MTNVVRLVTAANISPVKGNNLYALRISGGYSQEELAAQVGVCWQTIKAWEDGVNHPARCQFVSLMAVLGKVQAGMAPTFAYSVERQLMMVS